MSPRWIPDPNIRRGRSVVSNLHAHLVFITKYRRGAITSDMLARLEEICHEVCHDFDVTLDEFNGEDDHIHILIQYPPTVQLSKLVNALKGVTSRKIREEFSSHTQKYLWGNHFWSPSYFAGSVGGAPLTVLESYIQNQKVPE